MQHKNELRPNITIHVTASTFRSHIVEYSPGYQNKLFPKSNPADNCANPEIGSDNGDKIR